MSSATSPAKQQPGEQIFGEFRIIRELGCGSLSRVFLAEQQHPVRRQVALKILQSSLSKSKAASFFHREKQILARLEHQHIARIYDGGVSAAGWPYLVVEYVPGHSFTQFCDQEIPRLHDRLRLFLKVCDGVLYAHQRGIIHRDLKPGNILVTKVNGVPEPKLIDFGIAQAFGDEWETTLNQPSPTVAGTPVYMSPEQAGWIHAPIDIRSDIYALGMILYQLVTGHLPYEELGSCPPLPMNHHAYPNNRDIPLPSQLLKQIYGQDSKKTKAIRSRIRILRGDLDWIVLKALAQNPEKRYQTVQQLKKELLCFLHGQPLMSRPMSSWFRIRRFAKRNRWWVLSGVALLAAITVGYVALSWGLIKAREAERKAINEKDRANFTLNLVDEMLTSADPSADGINVKAVDILTRFGNRADWQEGTHPKVRASLHYLVGKTFFGLGEFGQSSEHLEKAFALAIDDFEVGHPRRLDIICNFIGQKLQGGNLTEAFELAQTYYPEAKEFLPKTHRTFLEFSHVCSAVYLTLGRLELTEQTLLPLLRNSPQQPKTNRDLHLRFEYQMANLLLVQGHLGEAKQSYQQLQSAFDAHFGRHAPATMELRHNLGTCFLYLEEPREAEMNYRQNLLDEAPMYLEGNARQRPALMGLVMALLDQAKFAEALERACEFLTVNENDPLEEVTALILSKTLLARAQWENHLLQRAQQNYQQAFVEYQTHLGKSDFQHTYIQYVLAILAKDFGDMKRAEMLANSNLFVYRLAKGENHPDTIKRQLLVTEIFVRSQQWTLANQHFDTLDLQVPNHPKLLQLKARAHFHQEQYKQALTYWDQCLSERPHQTLTQVWRLRTLLKMGELEQFQKSMHHWLASSKSRTRHEALQAVLLLEELQTSGLVLDDVLTNRIIQIASVQR